MPRRRKRKQEEHQNHEAWAIPYGDLVTLLLAFFVVMYATSSVNEGKFRLLSDALVAAFRGSPQTLDPVQFGHTQTGAAAGITATAARPSPSDSKNPPTSPSKADAQAAAQALDRVADDVQRAMGDLVQSKMIVVRRMGTMIEVEIRTDLLFPSGSATLSANAVKVIARLAAALAPYPNLVRVEGHTDSQPISTPAFPSNWELSAARAASVVHVFANGGLNPSRLSVIGLSQYRPIRSNASAEGRNANRRVIIAILSPDGIGSAPGPTAQPDSALAAGTHPANE